MNIWLGNPSADSVKITLTNVSSSKRFRPTSPFWKRLQASEVKWLVMDFCPQVAGVKLNFTCSPSDTCLQDT